MKSRRALILAGACSLCATTFCRPSLLAQEQPAEVTVRDLGDLQLDGRQRSELEAAMTRRDYARVETILVAEAERDPKSPRSAKLLTAAGGVFFLDGKYANAAIAWKKAEAIFPLDERTRFTLSMVYIRLNRRDWARLELDRLQREAPENPLYLYWLARLDYDAQDYTAAITRLQKVIEIDPKMMRAHDSLGLCYEYLGKPDDAIESYHRAVALNRAQWKPSAWPHVDLALTLIGVNRVDEAEKNLREAIGYDPKLPQAHYQLGRVFEIEGKLDPAVEALKKAAELEPNYPEPHLALGRIYHRLGNERLAKEEVRRFQELKKSHEIGLADLESSPPK